MYCASKIAIKSQSESNKSWELPFQKLCGRELRFEKAIDMSMGSS